MFPTSTFVLLSLVSSACATVFITSPTATSSLAAGQASTITWKDDGSQPPLQSFGAASVGLYVGNQFQQTLLQVITASVDVSTTGSLPFTPNPSVGANSNDYFIRFDSLGLRDAATNFPIQAFSAKFTLSGMTGTFNASVQAQINGQSTAPIVGQTTTSTPGSTTAGTTSQTSASKTSTTAKTTTTGKNAASTLALRGWSIKTWLPILGGILAGVVVV